ncbi:MAG: tetratricopeptide repeat protein [Bacteroidetes bacterium]|nr:tetratricopeptide repeat protein [Bacteroidota bacterium]MBU1114086.1 tetratricopeptide repeat protein [Bacteroidota bacterium]MBU1798866.1 tetratricopeptide repeat protein [Bacteroidota bacterium]
MNRIILVFLIFSTTLFSQSQKLDSLITVGIHQIYSIKFDEAEATFSLIQKKYPMHPAGKFFDAMIVWWKVLLELRSEVYDDLMRSKLELSLEQCEDILDENPNNVDAIFFKGGALGYRGRLDAIRENWLDAAADGKDALPLVLKAYELDSTNTDVILGFGIYNYYAEVIPEKFPIVEPLMFFFPKGDKKKGIEQLNYVADNGKYAKYEALYFLMTLNYSFENNQNEALKYAERLCKEFPDNPRFQSYLGRINIRRNDYSKATEIFLDIIEKYDLGYTGYSDRIKREALYYVGVNYKQMNNFTLAEKYFLNCETLSRIVDKEEETGFLANTLLYLGELNDIKGNREYALKYYKEVLNLTEFQNSHEKGKRYIKTPYSKN